MKQPNIIYIFSDELRADALSCYNSGKPGVHTPNIDRIASMGRVYENCYCNSPVCVPSRASLLTGCLPERIGVYQNEASLPPFSPSTRVSTFPELLAAEGFQTANFGKMHLPFGMNPFRVNNQEGSEMDCGLGKRIREIDALRAGYNKGQVYGASYPEGESYRPEKVTANAIRWMESSQSPFFIRISYLQPHAPVIVPDRYYQDLMGIDFAASLMEDNELSYFERELRRSMNADRLAPEELNKAVRYYHALVNWLDDQVGQILDFLETGGLMENSILIFNADHGACLGEASGLGKMCFHTSAMRVPLIIADTRQKEGMTGRSREICSNIDLAPTLFELLGLEIPAQFEGCSLLKEGRGEAYSSIGFGEKESSSMGYDPVGYYPEGHFWPRRACLRIGHYRLDLNVRMDGSYQVPPAYEDAFFTDTDICPEEDRNMYSDEEYREVVQAMKERIAAYSGDHRDDAENAENLHRIRELLDSGDFLRVLDQMRDKKTD